MQMDAMTAYWLTDARKDGTVYLLLIGANHKMMRWSQLVGKEQIAPNMQRTKIANRTV